jgi:hypothetical protein
MARGKRYPSDLTDVEWAVVEPLLPAPARHPRGGRPEKHPRRDVVDAILYVVRSGCAWRQLRAVIDMGGVYDLIAVHRDADSQGVSARVEEIAAAVAAVAVDVPHVPVVPVRMTEAWLLTSEEDLRWVAGNPNGRTDLNLPGLGSLERVADPKGLLKDVLARASGASGRRLDRFHKRFSQHRRQLLERLDPTGLVTRLPSWQHFVTGVENGLKAARDAAR